MDNVTQPEPAARAAVVAAILDAWGLAPEMRLSSSEAGTLLGYGTATMRVYRHQGRGPAADAAFADRPAYTAHAVATFLADKIFNHLPARG